MRFVGFTGAGGPEVLRMMSREAPEPGPGEVLVQVAYAGVNFAEVQHRRGEFGTPEGLEVPGLEVSGTVAALGAGVERVREGDPVAAYLPAFGGYAEMAVAPEQFVYPVGDIDLRVAAGFPCIGPTAYGLLHGAARLNAGETVLVHAAAGGVGSFVAHLARAAGAGMVIGTVGSADKIPYAEARGYDHVLLREGFENVVRDLTNGRGVDLALDPVGGHTRAASIGLLAPFGRLVAFGDAGLHTDLTYAVRDLWKRNVTVGGYNIADLARRAPERLAAHAHSALRALAGDEPPVPVTATYPLAEAADAHRSLETARTTGKTVLAVAT
jgi:NADPH:quinone reductase-like Zn-dependent oxidoreductase